jgi:predicted amidophosphoribosyltransferase
MIVDCPSCQKSFQIIDQDSDVSRRLICPHCMTPFEVTWLYPFTLDFIEDLPIDSNQSVESAGNRH